MISANAETDARKITVVTFDIIAGTHEDIVREAARVLFWFGLWDAI